MYIKGKVGGQKKVGPPHRWLMVVVPFVVGAVGWWWHSSPLVGGCTLPSPTDSMWTPPGLHESTWTPGGLHMEKTTMYNFV